MVTVSTAMEIAGNYPANTKIESIKTTNGKYCAFLYMLKDGSIHKCMLSTDAVFETAKAANDALTEVCESVFKNYNLSRTNLGIANDRPIEVLPNHPENSKETPSKTEEIVTDEQLNVAWANANFGRMARRDIIALALLKYASGYVTGHTIQVICRELELITDHCDLTDKGKKYLYVHFSALVSVFMETNVKRRMALLDTENNKESCWDAELRFGIDGQTALQARQLFAMQTMYKNWNNWRVRLGVWLIRSTGL